MPINFAIGLKFSSSGSDCVVIKANLTGKTIIESTLIISAKRILKSLVLIKFCLKSSLSWFWLYFNPKLNKMWFQLHSRYLGLVTLLDLWRKSNKLWQFFSHFRDRFQWLCMLLLSIIVCFIHLWLVNFMPCFSFYLPMSVFFGVRVQLHLVLELFPAISVAYVGRSKETLLFAGYSNWKIWRTFQVMVCVLRMNSRVTSVNALAKDNFVTVKWIARIAPMNSVVVSMFKTSVKPLQLGLEIPPYIFLTSVYCIIDDKLHLTHSLRLY